MSQRRSAWPERPDTGTSGKRLPRKKEGKEGLKAGDKVYAVYAERAIVLFQIGKKPIEEGMNILGAHIDSPRIDLKQQTLYETEGLAYFDTHYTAG